MSSDPFVFFGLDRKTATAVDVKRAYAAKLKTTRPDEDPAGFMALRASMEGALNQIKWRDQYPQDEPDDDDEDEDDGDDQPSSLVEPVSITTTPGAPPADLPVDDPAANAGDPESSEPKTSDLPPDIHLPPNSGASFESPDDRWSAENAGEEPQFAPPEPARPSLQPFALTDDQILDAAMQDIEELTQSEKRGDWQNWVNILDRPAFEALDLFQDLSNDLRNFICIRSGFREDQAQPTLPAEIPAEIIIQLDNRYGWSQQSGRDWHERDLNMWIARLVKAAEWASGQVSEANRTHSFFREHTASAQSDKPPRRKRSLAFNIGWTVLRLFILLSLISGIIELLGEA